MPRPRFERLDPERRRHILDVAAARFAEAGYGVSYNELIAAAGLSKGSAYYYFDDKADLFITVVEDALARLFAQLPPRTPADDAEGFWADLRDRYLGLMRALADDPRAAALTFSLREARTDPVVAERVAAHLDAMGAWFAGLLIEGRALGAVRSDVPDDLLPLAVLSMGEAVDTWVLADGPDAIPDRVDAAMRLFRSMASPA